MAKLLTPMASGSGTATSGERRFAESLKKHLEDDYLCWFNVPIGRLHQHPDFILLHPNRGLWVFEIKDWKINTLRSINPHTVEIHTPNGPKTVPNPLVQVRQYSHAIVNKLEADPQLRNFEGQYQGKLCFPYAYAVVLSEITRKQWDEHLSEEEQELVLQSRLLICKDEMTETTDPEKFQTRLWGMFQHKFGEKLSLPQIDRVRWHLFPEIRITSVQKDFFQTESATDESGPQFIKTMDLVQEQLARNLGNGHRVIHGVAGSGKTLILGFRCLKLAQELHKPILVLCFNITLAAKLRSFIEEKNLQGKVSVLHFHEWCKIQRETYHVPLIKSKKQGFERAVDTVIQGVEQEFIPRAQYGAILIDEGHDFEPHWLKLITQMVDPETDSLLLLYDDAQSIYRKNTKKFSLSSVGIKAQGRTTILRLNYRNTREILKFACDFASSFLEVKDADEDHIPVIGPEAAGPSGPPPLFYQFEERSQEIDYAVQCIRFWHDEEKKPLNEIAILYFGNRHAQNLHARLETEGIPALIMETGANKNEYNPRIPRVSLIPVRSSKGLEFDAVLVMGIGEGIEEDDEQNARLVYVAMTRARESLALTTSKAGPIQQRLAELAALLS